MRFRVCQRYRFFPPAARECVGADSPLPGCLAQNSAMAIAVAGQRASGCVLGVTGGHSRHTENSARGGVLLPLFAREGPGKLREDVRTAEIRDALVGDVLR